MYLFTLIFIILALILISYFFSGAETSLTSVSSARIHELSSKDNYRAKVVSILLQNKEKVLGCILLANTLVNITVSALATTIFVELLKNDALAVTLSSVVVTFTILLFAEVLPKTYAIHNPEKIALFSAPLIRLISLILSPIIIFVKLIVDSILKMLSLYHDKEVISAADAIRNLISLHGSDKTMLKQDIDMLNSVLDLAETEISEIMTHRKDVVAIDGHVDKDIMIQQILDSGHTNVPIWIDNQDNIEGVVNVYDLMVELRQPSSYKEIDMKKIIQKPIFVPDTTPLSMQLHNFRLNKNNFAIVVDEYGSLQGIVTLSDILEEIVGDIHYDDEDDIITISPNCYSINGKVSVRDLNRKLNCEISEDDASTIAGVILHAVERIPEVGEAFNLFDMEFTITKKEGNFITRIQLELKNQPVE